MPHILAFTAAARPHSISTALVRLAAESAEAAGCTVEIIDLTAPQLKCCQGCLCCRSNDGCSIGDGFIERVIACDGIIAGFPIYFGGLAGQGKVFLDRLYPMMDADFVPRHPNKKVIAVYAQGDPREQAFTAAIASANHVYRMCGWRLLDSILVTGTSAMGYTIPEALKERVKAAAAKLA